MASTGWIASVCVASGGAIGSLGRYWIGIWLAAWSRQMPWGTIGINVAGSFVIGLFGALTLTGGRFVAPEWARLFVMVGLCGGFTTFSAFSLQTHDLIRAGDWPRAAANVALSLILCLGAVAAGFALGASLAGDRIVIMSEIERDAV